MNKVEITLHGRQALVDVGMVALVLKKEALVKQAMTLRAIANTLSAQEHMMQAAAITSKIIRLNRKIRRNVQFI